ncbi:E3 ubiquitin-protein ligase MARCHF8-like [Antedon mediterranea]|uniref:E3 ubiquitin-protein ligase MARCHF8-like n=1 Tax=Antedon mediterranea TaxID=105859 RepID=UPI003AF9517E
MDGNEGEHLVHIGDREISETSLDVSNIFFQKSQGHSNLDTDRKPPRNCRFKVYTEDQERRQFFKESEDSKIEGGELPSNSVIFDNLKFDYVVSRPFVRSSASAPLAWSHQPLNGFKLLLEYSTKSETKSNVDDIVVSIGHPAFGGKTRDDKRKVKENTQSECSPSHAVQETPEGPAVLTACPTYFYTFDNISTGTEDGLDGNFCKICYMGDKHESFIQPPACACSGTMQYCHQSCLANWVAQSGIKKCELCGYHFKIRTVNMLHVTNWKCIPMTTLDKLYIGLFLLACSFILTTGVYVCWAMLSSSTAAMIERESTAAQVLFPVYTGFDLFCLSIIMYVLKGRITQMWRKWRAHNRSMIILSRPIQI